MAVKPNLILPDLSTLTKHLIRELPDLNEVTLVVIPEGVRYRKIRKGSDGVCVWVLAEDRLDVGELFLFDSMEVILQITGGAAAL